MILFWIFNRDPIHSYSLFNRGPGAPMTEEGFSLNLAPLISYSGRGVPRKFIKCSGYIYKSADIHRCTHTCIHTNIHAHKFFTLFYMYIPYMVVSLYRGPPIWTPKYYNPYYGNPKKVTLISGNPYKKLQTLN